MQYLGYAIIAAAFIAGFKAAHPGLVPLFALASTFLFAAERRKAVKLEPHRQSTNWLLDGAYLFIGQLLLMFFMFIFGWLMVWLIAKT